MLPSVSPDGTKLAFAREPFSGGSSLQVFLPGCAQANPTSSDFMVVVRDLASGHETAYFAPPGGDSALPVHVELAGDHGTLRGARLLRRRRVRAGRRSIRRRGVLLGRAGAPDLEPAAGTRPSGPAGQAIAIGYANRDHTSLDADPAGGWLLYLSGSDLFLAQAGTAAVTLTSGLIAAAWR